VWNLLWKRLWTYLNTYYIIRTVGSLHPLWCLKCLRTYLITVANITVKVKSQNGIQVHYRKKIA